ncbi:DUF4352 domain-containing protein [Paucisalibacillus globulus]|uniref:DUF4352 domain-containing protein n=1 Tax=Paucisalibacillus globulus TaxID=351095 RepID=UPI000410034A|nr:DUF4352 domain-containing protein [Paucisalibacillus globulus]
MVACSDDESIGHTDNQSRTDESSVENKNTSTDNSESSSDKEVKIKTDRDEDIQKNSVEHIEHQYRLKIGETGTVVSYFSNDLDDRISYEVTLNEIRYDEELETHIQLFDEVFAVVDVTIENIDDQPIDLIDLVVPSFGELGTNEYHSAVGSEFLQNIPELTIMEGELQPGESKTGNFVFDVDKSSKYHFAVGTRWDQIVTLAEWEISAEEVK